MIPKKLSLDEYEEYFQFIEDNTGCGIETEQGTWEEFFWIQVYLPRSYFYIDPSFFEVNPFITDDDLPEIIQVKFELFGIGHIEKRKSFVFKPWIIGIDNPNIYTQLENFLLFIPDNLFFNLIRRSIFLEQFTWGQLSKIRVLQDIKDTEFDQFGLNATNTPKILKTERLEIVQIGTHKKEEIETFYNNNWMPIDNGLKNKYFRPSLNVWFQINIRENNTPIGYLRLYESNSKFNGGMSLEYIIEKNKRNNGFATEGLNGIIGYLKQYSITHNLVADINDDNESSIRVIEKCGFKKLKTKNEFFLDLISEIDAELEKEIIRGLAEITMESIYVEKFRRYFN
ncbi:GNAT family N-acetyltransferase [Labilibaculum euxinus]